jgi:hypothetical protein
MKSANPNSFFEGKMCVYYYWTLEIRYLLLSFVTITDVTDNNILSRPSAVEMTDFPDGGRGTSG